MKIKSDFLSPCASEEGGVLIVWFCCNLKGEREEENFKKYNKQHFSHYFFLPLRRRKRTTKFNSLYEKNLQIKTNVCMCVCVWIYINGDNEFFFCFFFIYRKMGRRHYKTRKSNIDWNNRTNTWEMTYTHKSVIECSLLKEPRIQRVRTWWCQTFLHR